MILPEIIYKLFYYDPRGVQEKLYGPHRPILYSLKRGVRICFQNINRTSKKKDITVLKKGRRGWYPLLK